MMQYDYTQMDLPDVDGVSWSNIETKTMATWLFARDEEFKAEAYRNLNEALQKIPERPTESDGELALNEAQSSLVQEDMSILGLYFSFWTFEIESPEDIPEGPGTDLIECALARVHWGEIIEYMMGRMPSIEEDEFGPLFGSPEQAATYYGELLGADFKSAAILRELEIMRESLELALTSRNWETATSRMELARTTFRELEARQDVEPERWARIEQRFLQDSEEFATVVYLNCAQGLLDHGKKLKTPKGRDKYLGKAKDLLTRGLGDPAADKERLQAFMDDLPEHL